MNGTDGTDGTDEADGDADGVDRDRDPDAPTWAALFARTETYEVDESAVREALARRRERTND